MSRVGKLPVQLQSTVQVSKKGEYLHVSGPKGELQRKIHRLVDVVINTNYVVVSPVDKSDFAKALWGTTRKIISNMVQGVTSGFKSELELIGVGYRASQKAGAVVLSVGKSHSIQMFVPKGIMVSLPKPTHLVVEGIDKELVGQFVATIIKQRPTEPYKGKGIKEAAETVKKKSGKKN